MIESKVIGLDKIVKRHHSLILFDSVKLYHVKRNTSIDLLVHGRSQGGCKGQYMSTPRAAG